MSEMPDKTYSCMYHEDYVTARHHKQVVADLQAKLEERQEQVVRFYSAAVTHLQAELQRLRTENAKLQHELIEVTDSRCTLAKENAALKRPGIFIPVTTAAPESAFLTDKTDEWEERQDASRSQEAQKGETE